MKISPLFGRITEDAYNLALEKRNEYVTPEHLLRCSLNYKVVLSILVSAGGNVHQICRELDQYINEKIPVVPEEEIEKSEEGEDHVFLIEETQSYESVMNNTIMHCISCDKDFVEFSDALVCLMEEPQSAGAAILKNNGVDKLHLIEVISYHRYDGNGSDLETADGDSAVPLSKEEMQKAMESITSSYYEAKRNAFVNAQPVERENKQFEGNSNSALEKFAVNLTELAARNEFDVLVGREEEIDRTIQVLCRRTKNNVLHVGDAGVGKTAVTEGLASRIVHGEVPEQLKDFTIYSLSMGTLIAGTKFRGDFEDRLKKVIDELLKKQKAILFIDEIHTVIGAGSNGGGSLDAANILKPVLTNGKIRCIGSTTFSEYTKIFEKDRALARRFQKVDILEPTVSQTVEILKGLAPKYEQFHSVKYSKDSLKTAVELSVQYLPDRRLPDKAIDVMDEAGAWLKIHGEKGKVHSVTVDVIKKVTAKIARIPLESISSGEKDRLKYLEADMKRQIFGQDAAVEKLAMAVKKSKAGFRNPDRPEACFLFAGPTGVGKTELTKVLADLLGENLIRFDMSEYQEKHTVSRLIGSPPGYVGFEEGGLLTDALRKNPHSILLLDEIEKAHQDIYNILLQVMDYGQLTDNQGRKADFRNCMIIMTSNAGARDMEKGSIGFEGASTDSRNSELAVKEAVEKTFTPEFRNRLDAVIPFAHLGRDIALNIARKECGKIASRLAVKKVKLSVTYEAAALVADEGYDREYGARNIARTAENLVAEPLVDEVLFGRLSKGGKVTAKVQEGKIIFEYE